MAFYCYRAEAKVDCDRWFEEMADAGYSITEYTITTFGDPFSVFVEVDTAVSLDQILEVIGKVPDGHVMRRSLRPGRINEVDWAAEYPRD